MIDNEGETAFTIDMLEFTKILDDALIRALSLFIDSPEAWSLAAGDNVEGKNYVRDVLRHAVASEVRSLTASEGFIKALADWRKVNDLTQKTWGPGSTLERARIIREIMTVIARCPSRFSDAIAILLIGHGARIR